MVSGTKARPINYYFFDAVLDEAFSCLFAVDSISPHLLCGFAGISLLEGDGRKFEVSDLYHLELPSVDL